MTIQHAISQIHAPKGITSILAGLATGDYSVLPHQEGLESDHEKVKENVAKYQKQLDECTSDWSYWSILGDLAYWESLDKIYQAAIITGPNDLPDVPFEGNQQVVMDVIAAMDKYAAVILALAKEGKSIDK